MSFFLAIILYFIGTNIYDIYIFASLVTVLMVVDPIWCFYMKYQLEDDSFAIEWMQLNAITAGFFASFLLLPINLQPTDKMYISLTFFIVLTLRTILDYIFAWPMLYSKGYRKEWSIS
jgi:hypothetical protein